MQQKKKIGVSLSQSRWRYACDIRLCICSLPPFLGLYFYAITYGGSSAGINRYEECSANTSPQNLIGGLRKTDWGRQVLRGATAVCESLTQLDGKASDRAIAACWRSPDSGHVNISTEDRKWSCAVDQWEDGLWSRAVLRDYSRRSVVAYVGCMSKFWSVL